MTRPYEAERRGEAVQHTPGPWAIRFAGGGYPYTITTQAVGDWDRMPGRVGKQILRWGSFMLPSSAETLANARLIAAAPDGADFAAAFLAYIERSDLDDLDFGRGLRSSGLIEQAKAYCARITGDKS